MLTVFLKLMSFIASVPRKVSPVVNTQLFSAENILCKIIVKARHAVSIDENREDFVPTLWKDKPEIDLKQVWFAGIHSDVGGSYSDRGLSDCAMEWMIKEAGSSGLVFESHLYDGMHPDPSGKKHNEFKGIYSYCRKEYVRDIKGPIHISVKKRCGDERLSYLAKSRSLLKLLTSVQGNWEKIVVEE